MIDNIAAIYSAKISEVSGRVSGRLSELGSATGINFANVFGNAQASAAVSAESSALVSELISGTAASGNLGTANQNLLGASLISAFSGSGGGSGAMTSLVDYLTAGGNISSADSLLGVLNGNGASTDSLTQILSSLTKKQDADITAKTGEKQRYDALIESVSAEYGFDPALIKAVVRAESDYDPKLVSSAGAMGLMQLMPGTADGLGVADAFDPVSNVDGGVRYLLGHIVRYDGDIKMALAAYNCGAGTLNGRDITDLNDPEQFKKLPAETRGYLTNIQRYLTESGKPGLLNENFFK